jgi:hypothetical protein
MSIKNTASKITFFEKIKKFFLVIWDFLISTKSNNLFRIIISLISLFGAGVTWFGVSKININLDNKINQIVQQKIESINDLKSNALAVNGNGNTIFPEKIEEKNSNEISTFLEDEWNFYNDGKTMKPDNEGFYCPGQPGYPRWAMWTKARYKVDREIKIIFSLLDRTNNGKGPTLMFSYGDRTYKSSTTYYGLNIFDGDLKTIRLYTFPNGKNKQEGEGMLSKNAPLEFITLTISPNFNNKNVSSILSINPMINYNQEGINNEEKIFGMDFKINFPLSSENQGEGFQIGLGVSEKDCFKIISTNF